MAAPTGSVIIIKKKKGGGHGGHHGGAWKVAYADFVTAMMAFFLVMWLMGVDEETKAAISHYFNHPNTPYAQGGDPASQAVVPLGEKTGQGNDLLPGAEGAIPDDLIQEPMRPIDPMERALKSNEELSDTLKQVMESQAYGVEVSVDHLSFSLPEELLFVPGTTQLKPGAKKYLDRLGPIFRDYKGYVNIAGHTDGVGVDGKTYESSLTQAVNVMHYFINGKFGDADKFYPSGEGDRRPLFSDTNPEGQARNRRIEFTLAKTRNF
jgi:chemotaxis protein MotB